MSTTDATQPAEPADWVIHCWIYGNDPYSATPDCTLGTYPTRAAAEAEAAKLTCNKRVDRLRLRLDPPEWATWAS